MKIKATAVLRTIGELGQPYIHSRLEIQWRVDSPWLSFSLQAYGSEEFYLLMSLLKIGALRTGVEFTFEDLTMKETEDNARVHLS